MPKLQSGENMKLVIIVASTRVGRIGDKIAAWMSEQAIRHGVFDVSVADLRILDLPIFDEPGQPVRGLYTKDHTKRWSAIIEAADAFVVVTPEYNHSAPPALVNAFDYLHHEWKYKPVGFVGYGSTGGIRAIQVEKQLFNELGMMPIPENVNLIGVHAMAPPPLIFTEHQVKLVQTMLHELARWSASLQSLRA
jgi:NAD(P)H-dependent FMN reductase